MSNINLNNLDREALHGYINEIADILKAAKSVASGVHQDQSDSINKGQMMAVIKLIESAEDTANSLDCVLESNGLYLDPAAVVNEDTNAEETKH